MSLDSMMAIVLIVAQCAVLWVGQQLVHRLAKSFGAYTVACDAYIEAVTLEREKERRDQQQVVKALEYLEELLHKESAA